MFVASWLEVNRTWLRISGRSRPTDKGEGAGHPDSGIRGGPGLQKNFLNSSTSLYKHLSCFVLAQSNYLLILANDLAGGLLAWTFAHWTSGFNSNLLSKKNYSSQRNRRDCFWALGDAWMENEMQKFDNWVDQLYWPSERDSKTHVPLVDEGWKRNSKIFFVYAIWYKSIWNCLKINTSKDKMQTSENYSLQIDCDNKNIPN